MEIKIFRRVIEGRGKRGRHVYGIDGDAMPCLDGIRVYNNWTTYCTCTDAGRKVKNPRRMDGNIIKRNFRRPPRVLSPFRVAVVKIRVIFILLFLSVFVFFFGVLRTVRNGLVCSDNGIVDTRTPRRVRARRFSTQYYLCTRLEISFIRNRIIL